MGKDHNDLQTVTEKWGYPSVSKCEYYKNVRQLSLLPQDGLFSLNGISSIECYCSMNGYVREGIRLLDIYRHFSLPS